MRLNMNVMRWAMLAHAVANWTIWVVLDSWPHFGLWVLFYATSIAAHASYKREQPPLPQATATAGRGLK